MPRRRSDLWANVQAGTTTAVVIIPQGMAYALVAGLEPIHGLYASLLPLVAYALFGRSRELAVGPGALDTLLVGVSLSGLAFVNPDTHAAYAALLALMVAALQLALGALRAGFLVNFLSSPVLSGFTSAAALTIAASQLGNLLGFPLSASPHFHELAAGVARGLPDVDPTTAAVGLVSVALLVLGKRRWPRAPYALAVVVLATVVAALADLESAGLRVIGAVPSGLPDLSLPDLDPDQLVALLPTAATIAFVGYLTMISIAKTFADRHRYTISPNRELFAAGAANLAAGLTQGFPVSASFSRSAVHASAGSTSPYALLVTAAWVALTLLLLTDAIHHLPRATLAAIIITAVSGLVNVAAVRRLYRVKRSDMVLLLVTFAATLGVGIEPGILIGVGCSLMLFLYRTTRPHAAVLGRLGDSPDFRNVKNHPHATTYPGVLALRIDAQFYFGNVTFLRAYLARCEAAAPEPVRFVVLEACSLNQLDSSADAALHTLVDAYAARGVRFVVASAKMPVLKVMRASGFYDKLGADAFFMNVDDAVRDCLVRQAAAQPADAEDI